MTETEPITKSETSPAANKPRAVSMYEVHLDSWMRVPEDRNRPLTSSEIAPKLADYVRALKFTDVTLLTVPTTSDRSDTSLVIEYLQQFGIGVTHVQYSGTRANWDRNWTQRALDYFSTEAINRKLRYKSVTELCIHNSLDSILPLSHDWVVPGQLSLLSRMSGDEWQKFANLRLLYALAFATPGPKLIFMGSEFGQWNSWNPNSSLDWHLVQFDNRHGQLQHCVAELNGIYRGEPALQDNRAGVDWIENTNCEMSTLSFVRHDILSGDSILCAFNFTPAPRHNYRLGVTGKGFWREIFNSDAPQYGGSGQGNLGGVEASPVRHHHRSHSINVTLPPLGGVYFKRTKPGRKSLSTGL